MLKPLNDKNSSPYQKIDQKVDIHQHNKYVYPIAQQVQQKDEFKRYQYQSSTNNKNKRSQSIPIGNMNKDNKVKLKKNLQNRQITQEYFQKQLQIRKLQSKKLLQQLQQTQKNLLKVQKESWMIKNDYQSEKRKNEKLQRQNIRLIQQISTLEDKLKQISLSIGKKVEEDKSYLENLQSLKSQIEQKERIIEKLSFQNIVLAKSKQTIEKQTEIRNREESIELINNNYVGNYTLNMNRTIDFQRVTDLQSTNKSLFLPLTQTSLDVDWAKCKQRKQKHQIYIPSKDFRSDYILNTKHNNFTKQNRYVQPRGNYGSIDNQNRSAHFSLTKNQSHQKYFNNSISNHHSKNERKYSCDYATANHSLGNIIPIPYKQKLTTHRNRRDKANNTIIQRCKMMLNY